MAGSSRATAPATVASSSLIIRRISPVGNVSMCSVRRLISSVLIRWISASPAEYSMFSEVITGLQVEKHGSTFGRKGRYLATPCRYQPLHIVTAVDRLAPYVTSQEHIDTLAPPLPV